MSSSWTETRSPGFQARHVEADAEDVIALLATLEGLRTRLESQLPGVPARVELVIHPSATALSLAQPAVPALRRLTAPAARRYVTGWPTSDEIHVLAPRLLAERASNVPDSREMLMLTPAALYAQLAVSLLNRRLLPALRPRELRRMLPWAWLALGSGQWLSGQTAHARPAIARRLREGGRPAFPPDLRDAWLLGGSVLDLLAAEEGAPGALAFALAADGDPRLALERAFGGRPLVHTEGAWRSHLARLAGP
jgi:hypothetical protein